MGEYSIRENSDLSPANKAILQQFLNKANLEYREVLSSLPSSSKVVVGHEVTAAGGGVIFHWWGKTLWLNNLNSYRLSALLAGGASVAGLTAFITSVTGVGGVVAGGIAAVLGVASAGSLICNWNMRGVNIHLPNVGGVWCTPR